MAATRTSIISMAVMLLGHAPIQTLDNADAMVTAADQIFDMLLQSVLATGNWRFAIQIQQLTLSTEVPPLQTGWQNIYLLPAGFLKNIRIIPQNYNYEIYTNSQIWCNWGTQSPVYMEYAFLPTLNQLPQPFINYFIYEIACFLALSSAQRPDFHAALQAEKQKQWAIAAAQDAQNRPQFFEWEIPMLVNRNISGIIGPQIG